MPYVEIVTATVLSSKGTVSLARIWCFLPFSAMIVRALQERSYEKNRGNYLTYESSLQSYDTHVSTYKWLSLIRWLMYRNDIILTSFHLFRGSSLIYANQQITCETFLFGCTTFFLLRSIRYRNRYHAFTTWPQLITIS